MSENRFSSKDIWKGVILFGLNAATYKMALANSLLEFSARGVTEIPWSELPIAQTLHRLSSYDY